MTRPMLIQPVGAVTKDRIKNFGFELEVLTTDDVDGEREEYHDCGCEHCSMCGDYVTIEGAGLSPDAQEFMGIFRGDGLISQHGEPCGYHCDCSYCDYRRAGPTMTAQFDCSVGIEFVSRILSADQNTDEVFKVIEAYGKAMRRTGFVPQSGADQGNHVHVSTSGTDHGGSGFRSSTREEARHLLDTVMSGGNWEQVADGGVGRLRTYNSKPHKSGHTPALTYGSYGNWISLRGETFEYRLWNTPRIAERIAGHVGMSLALSRWAFKQVITNRDDLMAATVAQVHAQLVEHQDDIKAILLDCVPPALVPQTEPLINMLEYA